MSGFDASGVDQEFFAGSSLRSLVVVNIGKPAENAWFDRLPRLDLDEVVLDA
jgi:3-hydroxypropanoate dehydrogenase